MPGFNRRRKQHRQAQGQHHLEPAGQAGIDEGIFYPDIKRILGKKGYEIIEPHEAEFAEIPDGKAKKEGYYRRYDKENNKDDKKRSDKPRVINLAFQMCLLLRLEDNKGDAGKFRRPDCFSKNRFYQPGRFRRTACFCTS
jgi:hypothetical protein